MTPTAAAGPASKRHLACPGLGDNGRRHDRLEHSDYTGVTKAVGYRKGSSTVSYALPATLSLTVGGDRIAVTFPAWSVTQLVLS